MTAESGSGRRARRPLLGDAAGDSNGFRAPRHAVVGKDVKPGPVPLDLDFSGLINVASAPVAQHRKAPPQQQGAPAGSGPRQALPADSWLSVSAGQVSLTPRSAPSSASRPRQGVASAGGGGRGLPSERSAPLPEPSSPSYQTIGAPSSAGGLVCDSYYASLSLASTAQQPSFTFGLGSSAHAQSSRAAGGTGAPPSDAGQAGGGGGGGGWPLFHITGAQAATSAVPLQRSGQAPPLSRRYPSGPAAAAAAAAVPHQQPSEHLLSDDGVAGCAREDYYSMRNASETWGAGAGEEPAAARAARGAAASTSSGSTSSYGMLGALPGHGVGARRHRLGGRGLVATASSTVQADGRQQAMVALLEEADAKLGRVALGASSVADRTSGSGSGIAAPVDAVLSKAQFGAARAAGGSSPAALSRVGSGGLLDGAAAGERLQRTGVAPRHLTPCGASPWPDSLTPLMEGSGSCGGGGGGGTSGAAAALPNGLPAPAAGRASGAAPAAAAAASAADPTAGSSPTAAATSSISCRGLGPGVVFDRLGYAAGYSGSSRPASARPSRPASASPRLDRPLSSAQQRSMPQVTGRVQGRVQAKQVNPAVAALLSKVAARSATSGASAAAASADAPVCSSSGCASSAGRRPMSAGAEAAAEEDDARDGEECGGGEEEGEGEGEVGDGFAAVAASTTSASPAVGDPGTAAGAAARERAPAVAAEVPVDGNGRPYPYLQPPAFPGAEPTVCFIGEIPDDGLRFCRSINMLSMSFHTPARKCQNLVHASIKT